MIIYPFYCMLLCIHERISSVCVRARVMRTQLVNIDD